MDECKPLVLTTLDISAWTPKYDEPLSSVAFNFNLRHYTAENALASAGFGEQSQPRQRAVVGRYRLTVSKPVFKAPMVSALEATI